MYLLKIKIDMSPHITHIKELWLYNSLGSFLRYKIIVIGGYNASHVSKQIIAN